VRCPRLGLDAPGRRAGGVEGRKGGWRALRGRRGCKVRASAPRHQQFVLVLSVSLFAWLGHQTVTGKRDRQPEWIPLLGKIRDRRDAQRGCVLAAQWWNHGLVRISSKHSGSVIPLPNNIHWSLCRRAQMFQESGPK